MTGLAKQGQKQEFLAINLKNINILRPLAY
jgi:hypothetical protein